VLLPSHPQCRSNAGGAGGRAEGKVLPLTEMQHVIVIITLGGGTNT